MTHLPNNDISFRVFDKHVSLHPVLVRPVRALGLRAADARILCVETAVKQKQLSTHTKTQRPQVPQSRRIADGERAGP